MYIYAYVYNSKCISNLKVKRNNKIKVQYKRKANENKTPNLPGMDCSMLGLHVLTSKVWHRTQTAEGHHLPQTELHKIKQHTIGTAIKPVLDGMLGEQPCLPVRHLSFNDHCAKSLRRFLDCLFSDVNHCWTRSFTSLRCMYVWLPHCMDSQGEQGTAHGAEAALVLPYDTTFSG